MCVAVLALCWNWSEVGGWLHSFTSVLFDMLASISDMLIRCLFNLIHPALKAFVHSLQRPAGDFSAKESLVAARNLQSFWKRCTLLLAEMSR